MQWVARSLKFNEPLENGGIFELKGNELRIIIHHHKYYSEKEWFLSCATLGINMVKLGEISFDEAVEKSKKMVRKRIDELQNLVDRFILDRTENEGVRY